MTDKEKLNAIRAEVQNYIDSAHKAHTNITEGNFAHLLSFIDSLQEEPVSEEFEEANPPADNETLAKRIEDCNLSVRTTNICKANGIDTLGDLTKLHKTDWLKFRNSGKKSLAELDGLLHDNGLDWAKWQ